MAAHRDQIRKSFEKQPARTMAEACDRIVRLTGLRRGPSQVRKLLKAVPVIEEGVPMATAKERAEGRARPEEIHASEPTPRTPTVARLAAPAFDHPKRCSVPPA